MIKELVTFAGEIGCKPTWSSKELQPKLQGLNSKIELRLKEEGQVVNISTPKKYRVEEIKKYDVLYINSIGTAHYFLVHRIIEDKVYGRYFSTKEKPTFTIQKIEKDRIFASTESFATNTYLCIDIEEAKCSFVRVYESKKEADQIFKKMIEHYKNLFRIK